MHQKALELYHYVFSLIGTDGLARDLPLYLPGLSTTLSFASLSVQTPFLDLLDRHLLRLDANSLRPALRAIILAVLPGLEEETSEEFDRTLNLLDGFRYAMRTQESKPLTADHSTGDDYFWQCFFLACITSHGRRLGALTYLNRRLPRLGSPRPSNASPSRTPNLESSQALSMIVTTPEPGLLLRCFAAGLADEQSLVQRGFLDLLVTHLPLHSEILQTLAKEDDLQFLIAAASGVVARRDMSLNRRLWAWLLGPEPLTQEDPEALTSPTSINGEAHLASRTRYFEQFGLKPLTKTLLKMVSMDTQNPSERARPFRICLSMMDRWEIGGLVVPDIFMPIIRNVRRYEALSSNADFLDVLRSASVFFDGVESGLIWCEVFALIRLALGSGKLGVERRKDNLQLVRFILANFNVREEEMLTIHAPLTAFSTLALVEERYASTELQTSKRQDTELKRLALGTAVDLLHLIPQRAFARSNINPTTELSDRGVDSETSARSPSALESIALFYSRDQGNVDTLATDLPSPYLGHELLRIAINLICQDLNRPDANADMPICSSILILIISKVRLEKTLDIGQLLSSMHDSIQRPMSFSTFISIISLATNLYNSSHLNKNGLSGLVDPLVQVAWSYLSVASPKYHVETVKCLWQLQQTMSYSNREIEASLSTIIRRDETIGTYAFSDADSAQRFGVLWTHSIQDIPAANERKTVEPSSGDSTALRDHRVMLTRPLYLLLDALDDVRTQRFMAVKSWLQGVAGIDK